ncbi:MAG: iron-sulfur cluster assembly accessory protein [Euryarchaeota archaeon]|nr:iron-sulfur cluster assembly accessory protein [Euryarchaeota archaeon]MDE1837068.1 iron-sulfur cluster assembly accessory protein [Euryarchaeota archaeon]MDE1880999.1 iron-sulfur cluster assembly accessory protein [Euryarchaeota archaeon]MDE2046429.1 iron-sulfur cluster assembly accessory protein [Thermoplasmata archaeon]
MPPPTEVNLTITPSAREQLLKLRAQAQAETKGLRLFVQGGGCSGLTYGMQFDDAGEGDQVLDVGDGLKVIIDPASAPVLNGVTVDFLLSLEASGFKIKNPNAKSTCSCGKSFA